MRKALLLKAGVLLAAVACGQWCGSKLADAAWCDFAGPLELACTSCVNAGYATIRAPGMPPGSPGQLLYLNVTCQNQPQSQWCFTTHWLGNPGPKCTLNWLSCDNILKYQWSTTNGSCTGGIAAGSSTTPTLRRRLRETR